MCSIFLIKPQLQKTAVFAAKYQLKRFTVAVAILNCPSFRSLFCLVNRKGKSLNKQCFCLSFGIDTTPQLFCYLFFIALSMICCSKSAQKSAVQECQVATVVMETTQLVLRQFKNFFIMVNGDLNKVSLCQK